MKSGKVHYPAVIVAAVAHFVLGAVWFTVLSKPWQAAIGKTMAELSQTGNATLGYVVAFVANLIIAWVLARLMITAGRTTPSGGMALAALLWLGFTGTTMGTEFAFEARSLEAFAIIAGYPLIGMLIMGAILGAWRGKRSPAA
ncbi:MAG TPA: DUF1761 domain-containing protein [Terriglobia bacterium]|nr:DUF1761 domain-containing protein [Terriglobia bacterium]